MGDWRGLWLSRVMISPLATPQKTPTAAVHTLCIIWLLLLYCFILVVLFPRFRRLPVGTAVSFSAISPVFDLEMVWYSCLIGAALLAVAAAEVTISNTVTTDNANGNFNFEVLGSLCLLKGTSTTVNVRTINTDTVKHTTQHILVFTESTIHEIYDNNDSSCDDQAVGFVVKMTLCGRAHCILITRCIIVRWRRELLNVSPSTVKATVRPKFQSIPRRRSSIQLLGPRRYVKKLLSCWHSVRYGYQFRLVCGSI